LTLWQRDYRAHLFDKDKAGRLTIIDPNRPDNNISGGTREIQSIQACFSSAHQILDDLLTKFDPKADNHGFSFLKDLIGGNFEHYEAQRMKCKNLYFGLTGKEAESNPTAPLPLPQPSTASGFAAPPSTSSIQQAAGKRKAAAPKKVSSYLLVVNSC
jgi:non-canonical poly(A) RNA polymerase PAPD5/7